MQASEFLRAVTMDHVGFLERALRILDESRTPYCVIGGQGVNAYVEPLVSLDLDVAVAATPLPELRAAFSREFHVEDFPHSLNVSAEGSDLRLQIQKDPRYADFVARSEIRDVLGMPLRVAAVEDVLRGKVWAAGDPARRPSKRQKDLADIARLLEAFPRLASLVPDSIKARLEP